MKFILQDGEEHKIGEVQALHVGPGEVLVIKLNGTASQEQMQQVRLTAKSLFGDIGFVVIDDEVQLLKVTRAEVLHLAVEEPNPTSPAQEDKA